MVTPVEAPVASIALKIGSYGATVILSVVTALWARKADVGRMIDQRWTTLSDRMDKRCKAAEERCDAAEEAHAKCETELTAIRKEIRELMTGQIAAYTTFVNPKPK